MRSDQHSRGDASAIRRQLSGTGTLEGLAPMPQGHRPVLCAECRPQRSVPVGRHPALRASKQPGLALIDSFTRRSHFDRPRQSGRGLLGLTSARSPMPQVSHTETMRHLTQIIDATQLFEAPLRCGKQQLREERHAEAQSRRPFSPDEPDKRRRKSSCFQVANQSRVSARACGFRPF